MSTDAAVTIREATEEDAPLILQFIRELAEYEKALDRVTATEDVVREAFFGERAHAKSLIVHVDDEVAAFAIYFFSFSSFSSRSNLYLEDIFLRPQFRGYGIGKKLMAHIARIANDHGCNRMEWAVLNWNEPSIGFYKRLGAEPVTDWTVFHLEKQAMNKLASD
jgi:GNAT superfamily N-acetyltransferase